MENIQMDHISDGKEMLEYNVFSVKQNLPSSTDCCQCVGSLWKPLWNASVPHGSVGKC